MPIRGVSRATYPNQAPYGQNPFAKSNLDSDRTNQLHSSPEVNLSASTSTTLSSYQHEPVEPSKFIRRVHALSVLQSGNWTQRD